MGRRRNRHEKKLSKQEKKERIELALQFVTAIATIIGTVVTLLKS